VADSGFGVEGAAAAGGFEDFGLFALGGLISESAARLRGSEFTVSKFVKCQIEDI